MREIRKLLRDDQWTKLGPLLPGKAGDRGATAQDNRLFVEAVLWIVRTGSPWRDLPADLGNWLRHTRDLNAGANLGFGNGLWKPSMATVIWKR